MAEKKVKCAFKHCQCESRELSRDHAVQVGKRYMHPECAEKSEYIAKIRDLYYNEVSSTVVVKQLVNVINNLVISKNVDPKFLYFALNYAISNKIPIRAPYGLHYIADNAKIKAAWKKKQAAEIAREIKTDVSDQVSPMLNADTFKYTAHPTSGVGGILGGNN